MRRSMNSCKCNTDDTPLNTAVREERESRMNFESAHRATNSRRSKERRLTHEFSFSVLAVHACESMIFIVKFERPRGSLRTHASTHLCTLVSVIKNCQKLSVLKGPRAGHVLTGQPNSMSATGQDYKRLGSSASKRTPSGQTSQCFSAHFRSSLRATSKGKINLEEFAF